MIRHTLCILLTSTPVIHGRIVLYVIIQITSSTTTVTQTHISQLGVHHADAARPLTNSWCLVC